MFVIVELTLSLKSYPRGNGAAIGTHSPPTSEVRCSNPGPYVGKMVVVYRCIVNNTEN